jgi:hypothetical protein
MILSLFEFVMTLNSGQVSHFSVFLKRPQLLQKHTVIRKINNDLTIFLYIFISKLTFPYVESQ